MLLLPIILAGVTSLPIASAASTPSRCWANDRCSFSVSLPPSITPAASSFCESYIHLTPGTVTRIATTTTTVVKAAATKTVTVPVTATQYSTKKTSCTVTSTTSLTTQVFYPTRAAIQRQARDAAPSILKELTAGCSDKLSIISSKVSRACSCFLTSPTVTSTSTATVTVTSGKGKTTTISATGFVTTTVTSCVHTSTSYSYTGAFSCGIANPTVVGDGEITCTSPMPAGATVGRLRIEGGTEGTIYEDCIASDPRNISTPSGNTHLCDGTNDSANPTPGATCTTQLDEAAKEASFPYDGTYSTQFQDYFITSIDATTETSNQFWGLLLDLQFTEVGGCQQEIQPGGVQETLWAFDAFNANTFLRITPDFRIVSAGTTTVQVTVTDSQGAPFSGASIQGGTTSDTNGVSEIQVPSHPGCYQYKATNKTTIRSNAFYLTVLPHY